MFWQKQKENLNSKEYEKLLGRIVDLENELKRTNGSFEVLHTTTENLRGWFNRKLAGMKKDEIVAEAEKPKDLNKSEPKVFSGLTYGNLRE